MAEKANTNTNTSQGDLVATYSAVTESDSFKALDLGGRGYGATVQVTGTFGGATLAVQGSNDGANYAALTKLDGNAASVTAAGILDIAERPPYIKLVASGGTSQSLNAVVVVSRS